MESIESSGTPDQISSRKKLYDQGKLLRKECTRKSHGKFKFQDRDPIAIHLEKSENRIEYLLPIHFERMAESAFAYFRGAAAMMAGDLATQQNTTIKIQICGDCHLLNFGGFATPERKIIFDINDFDETIQAPWEWDVKRLAASFMIAGKSKGLSREACKTAAYTVAHSYKRHMQKCATMTTLELWYAHIELENLLQNGDQSDKFHRKRLRKAMSQIPHEKEFQKLTTESDGEIRILNDPPLIYHASTPEDEVFLKKMMHDFEDYPKSIANDRKVLLSQYKIQDIALKVVGVGSVGTRCGIILLLSGTEDPLFLQFKEAGASSLQAFTDITDKCPYENQGQRIVEGQKIMQSASDIFLGWGSCDGMDFYFRQLRDAKIKPVIEVMDQKSFNAYAITCGRVLAQAHARTGSASVISGYIGKNDAFANAVRKFATAYEIQNAEDYEAFLVAIEKGLIKVKVSDDQ